MTNLNRLPSDSIEYKWSVPIILQLPMMKFTWRYTLVANKTIMVYRSLKGGQWKVKYWGTVCEFFMHCGGPFLDFPRRIFSIFSSSWVHGNEYTYHFYPTQNYKMWYYITTFDGRYIDKSSLYVWILCIDGFISTNM